MSNCPDCGKEISKKANACPNCGRRIKKPIYKRIWVWAIAIVLIIFIAAVNSGRSGDDATNIESPTPTSASSSASAATTPATAEIVKADAGEGDIGKYHVNIKAIELAEDYAGNPAVVVTYEWTNNSDESKAFGYALKDTVFQKGIECETSIIKIVTDDSDGKYKEIKPGITYEFRCGYLLNDTESDIEIEVQEYFTLSSNPTIVSRVFELNP